MSMSVNTNISAMNSQRHLTNTDNAMQKSLERLSSGYRINKAADDAAGLAISEKMRAQTKGLNQAGRNAQDGISLIQTAEGSLNETQSILQRMRELSVQASNDTLTADDRGQIQQEMDQLSAEIDRISGSTQFNNKNLLNGSISTNLSATGTNASSIDASKSKATANTQSGVYTVTFTTAATQATKGDQATATAAATGLANTNVATIGAGAAGTLTVNGQNITLAATDTLDNVVAKINNVTASTGVTASAGGDGANDFITLKSKTFGSDGTLNVSGTNATLKKLGLVSGTETATSAAGVDATGTINGQTAVGKGNTLTLNKAGDAADGLSVQGYDTDPDGAGPATAVANTHTASIVVDNSNALSFQIGANNETEQRLSLAINDMSSKALGVDTIDVSTAANANASIDKIQSAIDSVSTERSKLGAYQNRLEHTVSSLATSAENLTAAESRIRDVDMAKEMSEFTKNQVLSQAGVSMLAQANQSSQSILKLLG